MLGPQTEYMANSRWFGMRRGCGDVIELAVGEPQRTVDGLRSGVGIAAGIGSSLAVTALTLGGGWPAPKVAAATA